MTAHFLGGCAIGADAGTGVIDAYHRVYGHSGLHVIDGSGLLSLFDVIPVHEVSLGVGCFLLWLLIARRPRFAIRNGQKANDFSRLPTKKPGGVPLQTIDGREGEPALRNRDTVPDFAKLHDLIDSALKDST